MNKKELDKTCVAAATNFFQARPWLLLENDDYLVFDLPGEPCPVVVTVMGMGGEEFGIFALRGPNAMAAMATINESQRAEVRIGAPLLSVSLEERRDLEGPWLRFIESAGHKGRTAPMFLAKTPGELSRLPRRDELELLIYILRAVTEAKVQGRLSGLTAMVPERPFLYPRLSVTGSLARPRVAFGSVDALDLLATNRDDPADSIEPPDDLIGMDHRDVHYLVGFRPTAAGIVGDAREVHLLIVIEHESGLCHVGVVQGRDLRSAASHLFDVFAGAIDALAEGWPARVTFDDQELLDSLRAGLEAHGVDCDFESVLPPVAELAAKLDEITLPPPAGDGERDRANESARPGADRDVLDSAPPGDDLDAWKELDYAVSHRVTTAIRKRAIPAERSWRKFFGVPRSETPLESEDYAEMKLATYFEWYANHHRNKRGATIVDRILGGVVTAGFRAVLESRRAAVPSLYRIANIVTGESLDLVDLVSGAEVTVHDKSLSTSAEDGLVLVLRVYPVGDFRFASIAGPAMPGHFAHEALEYLEEDVGLSLDGESGRRSASHLLGRLWSWSEGRMAAGMPALTNTEGHRLLWQSASFSVDDPTALARALDQGEEFDRHGEGTGEWGWFDEHGMGGGRRHLGSLNIFGDELLLEVNSAERLRAARSLLERLPGGVRFKSVKVQELDPRNRDARPLDDRLPGRGELVEIDATMQNVVQDMIRKHCFSWLDEKIPALGGRTPRETCGTPAGRKKVERLIRTYPDPGGVPGVVVPREEMLRELGLA